MASGISALSALTLVSSAKVTTTAAKSSGSGASTTTSKTRLYDSSPPSTLREIKIKDEANEVDSDEKSTAATRAVAAKTDPVYDPAAKFKVSVTPTSTKSVVETAAQTKTTEIKTYTVDKTESSIYAQTTKNTVTTQAAGSKTATATTTFSELDISTTTSTKTSKVTTGATKPEVAVDDSHQEGKASVNVAGLISKQVKGVDNQVASELSMDNAFDVPATNITPDLAVLSRNPDTSNPELNEALVNSEQVATLNDIERVDPEKIADENANTATESTSPAQSTTAAQPSQADQGKNTSSTSAAPKTASKTSENQAASSSKSAQSRPVATPAPETKTTGTNVDITV